MLKILIDSYLEELSVFSSFDKSFKNLRQSWTESDYHSSESCNSATEIRQVDWFVKMPTTLYM